MLVTGASAFPRSTPMPYLCPCTCTYTFEFSPPWSTLIFIRILLIGNGSSLYLFEFYSRTCIWHFTNMKISPNNHRDVLQQKTGQTWEYQHDISCKVWTPTTRVWLQYAIHNKLVCSFRNYCMMNRQCMIHVWHMCEHGTCTIIHYVINIW